MKRTILLCLIHIAGTMASFSQSSPWKANGVAIPARLDLDVHWLSPGVFPREVWEYDLLPNKFSPEVISNLVSLCLFTAKDKVEKGGEGIVFQTIDHSRILSISFASGNIQYEMPERLYSATNLAVGVPSTDQLAKTATTILDKLHIGLNDITGWRSTNKFDFSEPLTLYYLGDTTITNIPYRTVYFRRSVDGMPIAGHFYRFNVGERGEIAKISMAWPNMKRAKSYPTVSPNEVVHFLRSGNAIRGPVPTNIGDLDWLSIKSVTIKKAIPSYLITHNQLYPFLRLDVLVNTGSETIEIGLDCPIIDETKL